ncbi:MAG: hypothetical protein K2N01_12685 [Lachnospiraceae bacterium]|nr:hypothetical protein [Lachnospiraceae bacterium]
MKNSEIVAGYMGLLNLVEKKEKYPVKFSFAITKNLKLLEQLNKDFETERNRLLDIYNVKDETGEPTYKTTGKIDIVPEIEENWKKDVQELLNIEVEVKIHTVTLADLEGVNLTAEDMFACEFMIME